MKPSPISTETRVFVKQFLRCPKEGDCEGCAADVDAVIERVRKEALQEALDSLPKTASIWKKIVIEDYQVLKRVEDRDDLIKEARANIAALLDKD